ncbi:MAG: isochorismatase family protein [Armatimonadetes bacterium]|nr:isochorismatase family protein [Armatimonadota bacterium]
MPPAVLITQCLQNDFVKPIGRHEALPNMLHVGYEEARRLMGERPAEGPVARFMAWAYGQREDALGLVHIRDWHDARDAHQREHLGYYGDHCLADSWGAAFCFDVQDPRRASIVNSRGLNDFLGTGLEGTLVRLRPQRVGIVGVWTEAKVSFLAYDLRTRRPELEIGVCSALTASSSRAQHFLALDQMRKLLHVAVFESVASFTEWLTGDAAEVPLPATHAEHPGLEGAPDLSPADAALVRYLFRDCRTARLHALGGGFSGNAVLMAHGVDLHGHEQVPHVVKIGPQHAIGAERAAFERIEAVLGNSAPRIADFADAGDRGAIKYRYAAMGRGESTTFQRKYASGLGTDEIERILRVVFEDQLGRLYAAATPERVDLLAYYGFDPSYAPRVESRVGSAAEILEFPGGRKARNVAAFYRDLSEVTRPPSETHSFAYVHGDLNGANIVLDATGTVWLIDFFHTHRGHVLRDLVKLENDLLYIFTPLESESDLEAALAFTDRLLRVADLGAPLDDWRAAPEVLRRAWGTVRVLRAFYPGLLREDSDPRQLWIGQLRYAVHTLSFDESSPLQKRWALYAACRLAEKILSGY